MRYTGSAIRSIGDIMKAADTESFDELKDELERLCSDIALKFSLYYPNKTPRRATIVEILAGSTCISCIFKRLTKTASPKRIDGIYLQCHRLAVSTLAEELYNQFKNEGYVVSIADEYEKEFGKVDISIRITNYGLHVQSRTDELMLEVKSGFSINLAQIFRYLIDSENERLILWRIRSRQVLVFDGARFKPLLARFMKTCISRANRLLASTEPKCEHMAQDSEWLPSELEIQAMVDDFAVAVTETIAHVTEKVFEILKAEGRAQSRSSETPFLALTASSTGRNNTRRRKEDPKQKNDSISSNSREK